MSNVISRSNQKASKRQVKAVQTFLNNWVDESDEATSLNISSRVAQVEAESCVAEYINARL
jgi:hypothetical protein